MTLACYSMEPSTDHEREIARLVNERASLPTSTLAEIAATLPFPMSESEATFLVRYIFWRWDNPAVVLPLKRDAAMFEGSQAVIGNRHAVSVAGQILENALRSAKGRLDVSGTGRFPITATGFGLDVRRIRRWRRRSSTSPQAIAGWWIWIWRSSSTGSITTD